MRDPFLRAVANALEGSEVSAPASLHKAVPSCSGSSSTRPSSRARPVRGSIVRPRSSRRSGPQPTTPRSQCAELANRDGARENHQKCGDESE